MPRAPSRSKGTIKTNMYQKVNTMVEDSEKVLSIWDVVKEMQRITNEHIRLSWSQYREIRELYGTPYKFWRDAMQDFFPQSSEKFLDMFNRWFDEQVQVFEKNMQGAVTEGTKGIDVGKIPDAQTREFQKFVQDNVDLWIKNYQKLTDSREEYDSATLAFLKSIFPESMHNMLENANKWKREQTEKIEDDVMLKLKAQKDAQKGTLAAKPVAKKATKKVQKKKK